MIFFKLPLLNQVNPDEITDLFFKKGLQRSSVVVHLIEPAVSHDDDDDW